MVSTLDDAIPKSGPGGLSERQCECLRLVARDRCSKEIGRHLGISHETVDKHIALALRKLEMNDRYVAARWLADQEQRTHPVVIPPQGEVPDTHYRASPSLSPQGLAAIGEDRLRDNPRPFGERPAPANSMQEQRPIEAMGRTTNPFKVVAWIAVVAASLAIIGSAAKPLADGFQAFSNFIEPYH